MGLTACLQMSSSPQDLFLYSYNSELNTATFFLASIDLFVVRKCSANYIWESKFGVWTNADANRENFLFSTGEDHLSLEHTSIKINTSS